MALLIGMAICYGSLAFLTYSLSAAHANDFAPPDKLIQTAGSLLVTYGFGAIVGPIASSVIMGRYGSDKLFLCLSVVSFSLCLYAIYRSTRRQSVSAEQKGEFNIVAVNISATKQLLVNEAIEHASHHDDLDRQKKAELAVQT